MGHKSRKKVRHPLTAMIDLARREGRSLFRLRTPADERAINAKYAAAYTAAFGAGWHRKP